MTKIDVQIGGDTAEFFAPGGMSAANGHDPDLVVCCFDRSTEISSDIDNRLDQLRRDVAEAKILLSKLTAELTTAFDAQLAAVEMRRKAMYLSMANCPNPEGDIGGIEHLDLSVRAERCFKEFTDVKTIGELTRMSDAELLRIPNFGKCTLREVRAALARRASGP